MVEFVRDGCFTGTFEVKVKSAASYPVRSGEIGRMGVQRGLAATSEVTYPLACVL